ncbi:class I SAM-dependent methyltransferase [Actinokineospora soli]|uniref:Class I SAM-dependent methyltransferase n=1 Tax=Actinokineospora soli TaxID=1048753 RepID=A0ABW2TQE8_9PSEU
MTVWGKTASENYHRRATGMLRGFYRRLATDVPAEPGTVLVDVGTGPGMLLHHLAGSGAELHGVDPSPDMVAIARRVADDAGLAERLTFAAGSAEDLPFPDASVDVLVSSLSLHHWADVARAATEARRVLRPGGRLLAYDFRFVRMDRALAAMRAEFDQVSRTRVRLLYARLEAR